MILLAALALLQQDYFPLEPGTTWTYRTDAGKDYVKRVLGREAVDGAECAVLQYGDVEKHWLSSSADGVRVHRSRGVHFDKPLLLYKFPLGAGEAWTGKSSVDGAEVLYSFKAAGEEELEVPAGKFKAIRVDWTMGQTRGTTWLAKGVGPVRETFGTGGLSLVRIQRPTPSPYPLAKGNKWTYKTDYDDVTEIVHEIVGVEKVGDVECFVLEVRSHNPEIGAPRVLRKEWLAAGEGGTIIHQQQRGRTVMPVEKPFYKIKDSLRKDDEWRGQAQAETNAPRCHAVVLQEEDVEVPAGKYRGWKLHVRSESGRHVTEGDEWYVPGVGMVKYEMTFGAGNEGTTVTAELKKFEPGK
jgi:hypothetical protein